MYKNARLYHLMYRHVYQKDCTNVPAMYLHVLQQVYAQHVLA